MDEVVKVSPQHLQEVSNNNQRMVQLDLEEKKTLCDETYIANSPST
jgi:hypothetical protein